MKVRKWIAQRYQVNKQIQAVLKSHHPWVFRSHVSSAITVFSSGQLLHLVDHENRTVGYGIYDPEGLIAIRVLSFGANPLNLQWCVEQIRKALKKRENLRKYTEAFRVLHGENDGFPGVVIDVYGTTAVLQTYSSSVDALGRYLVQVVAKELSLKNIIWKLPTKRVDQKKNVEARVLRGHLANQIKFREGKMEFTVQVGAGQKSGAFLDLRALRKWLSSQDLKGKRVLNLFSYTGTLGLASEVGGAKEIWNVDISSGALETAEKFHALDSRKHKFIQADIFEWLKTLSPKEKFDVIIVDPPQMTSQTSQVPIALKAYRHLYSIALKHLNPRGSIVGACCTSRISRAKFKETVCPILMPPLRLLTMLEPEDDHPVGFPEGDYLKVLVFGY